KGSQSRLLDRSHPSSSSSEQVTQAGPYSSVLFLTLFGSGVEMSLTKPAGLFHKCDVSLCERIVQWSVLESVDVVHHEPSAFQVQQDVVKVWSILEESEERDLQEDT